MGRRGGRSSIGRASLWPLTRGATYFGSDCAMGAGLGIWLFLGANVGLTVFGVGLVSCLGTWLYNRRWRRLQNEVFKSKHKVATWRRRLARRVVRAADWVDPGARLRWSGYSFTLERGVGYTWHSEGPYGQMTGCPVWYLDRDYILAHEQAERPV